MWYQYSSFLQSCSIQLMELKFTEAARALPKDILEHFLLDGGLEVM